MWPNTTSLSHGEYHNYGTYNINFTSRSINFTSLSGDYSSYYRNYYMNYGDTKVYEGTNNDSSWTNSNYKTITITGGTDVTTTRLIYFLRDNAT